MVSWPVILFQSHKFGAKYLFFDFLVFLHCKSVGFPLKGSLKVSRLVCRQACEVLSVVEKQIRCSKSCDGNCNFSEMRNSHSTVPLPRLPYTLRCGRWQKDGAKTAKRRCLGFNVPISANYSTSPSLIARRFEIL